MDQEKFNFSVAFQKLLEGKTVSRCDGMCIKAQLPDVNSKMSVPYLYVAVDAQGGATAQNIPWIPSYLDMFAVDYFEVAEKVEPAPSTDTTDSTDQRTAGGTDGGNGGSSPSVTP